MFVRVYDEDMVAATLTSQLLRKELFWVALALFFGGTLVPDTVYVGTLELGTVVSALGGLLITAQIIVSIIVILRASYEGWRYGYAEGLVKD
jgi:hypothetical protein